MSEHIFRYRHNLRAGIIANIFAYLPEDILKRHIESDDINHINMLVDIDRETLDVNMFLREAVDYPDHDDVGFIAEVNHTTFTLVGRLTFGGNLTPALRLFNNHSYGIFPVDTATENLGLSVLNRYYPLPDNEKMRKRYNTMKHYVVTIDVATQTVLNFKPAIFGHGNSEENYQVVARQKKGTVSFPAYAANGGFSPAVSPARIGDNSEPYAWNRDTIGDENLSFQELILKMTSQFSLNEHRYASNGYPGFDQLRFGNKYWYKIEYDTLVKKVLSPRIKLSGSDLAFYSWWINTPAIDSGRDEGEAPVILHATYDETSGKVIFSPLPPENFNITSLLRGLLPRTRGKAWASPLSLKETATLTLELNDHLSVIPGMYTDLNGIYCYAGEEEIATAVVMDIVRKNTIRDIEKIDRDIAALQEKRNKLIARID